MSALPTTVAPPTKIPWMGLTAVLMGTFISTLTGRLSNFGLADIRGAVHAGFDEGAWITTAQTVAQMLVTPAAVWLGTLYGPRRTLLASAMAFGVVSALTPFATNLETLLAMQFMSGLASGFFIPLTLSFILLSTPPKFWSVGIAVYALNLELSLNISASAEGWYVEHLNWKWIFWQNVPLAAIMAACLFFGVQARPKNTNLAPTDRFGLITGGIGLALIYAGLDQGNRLDWLNSGLITALLASGIVFLAGFFVHEARAPHPLLNLNIILKRPIPNVMLLVSFLRLTLLSTAYLIPVYLQSVRFFRALQVGDTLIWIAVPQLLTCTLAAFTLRHTDPRLVASTGFILIALACLSVAAGLTPIWGSEQFLMSQLLQSVGQSFAMTGTIFYAVCNLRLQDALTFGACLQSARLLGGEIGTAFMATLTRKRSQIASNLLGLHVQSGDPDVTHRLQVYAGATARAGSDPGAAMRRATEILSSTVRNAATTQSVIDGYITLGGLTAVAMLAVMVQRRAPPGPASPVPWRESKRVPASEPMSP